MRIILLYFIIIFTFFPCLSSAAPCYGTRMPARGGFFTGEETYSIFERHLEKEEGELRSLQHFLLVSYGISEWLCLDLKGGAGYIKQHPIGSDEVDYPASFAGGYGLRLKVYERDNARAVLGFQHISVHPKKIHLQDIKNMAILDDWQVSFLLSYALPRLTPYLGGKWSRVDYIHWVEEDRKRNMSDLTRSLGLVLGLDIPCTERVWVNIEGHLVDEEAVSLALNFEF